MTKLRDIIDNNNLKLNKRERVACIYKITSPNNRIYIGSTVNLYARINNYCRKFDNKNFEQPKLYNSFAKYGIDKHKFEIEYITNSDEELHNKEVEIIDKYNSRITGLNICSGGRDFFTHSEETKQIISEKNKGRVMSKEAKLKLSIAHKGRVSNRKGVKLSQETKDKISNSKKQSFINKNLITLKDEN